MLLAVGENRSRVAGCGSQSQIAVASHNGAGSKPLLLLPSSLDA